MKSILENLSIFQLYVNSQTVRKKNFFQIKIVSFHESYISDKTYFLLLIVYTIKEKL